MNKLHSSLVKAAAKVKPSATREEIEQLIESGRINANDTVYVEKALSESAWESIFVGSICCLLDDEQLVRRGSRSFFAKFNIGG